MKLKTLKELQDIIKNNTKEYDTNEYMPMNSAQGEAQDRLYKKVIGKKRTWYYNNAYHIYTAPIDVYERRRGMAGVTLTFHLKDGTEDDVTGPWMSNTSALFKDTGIDLRDQHLTLGVISLECDIYILKKLIHKDEDWTIGCFNRIENMAEHYANLLKTKVYFYSKSHGGSVLSWKEYKNEIR